MIVGVVVWATTGGSSGPAALPGFTISVSQGSVASPDSIIESQPSLAKLIPAHLHYVPFEAGVTAIAEMKSGAVQAISGVGNPPVTEAIGSGTGVTVVMGWGFDDDQLLVPASVTSPAQLAGKSVGVLVGSSEDYELLGYLALQHLTGKVKVVPFSDENAAGAAALSGAVDAAYVYGSPATELLQEGLPLAGQRPADRQARRSRPGRDRGRDQRDQEQPGAGAGLRMRRAPGQPGHDRAAGGEVPGREFGRAGGARRPDRRGDQGLPVHPARRPAVLARLHPARPGSRIVQAYSRRARSWSRRDG